MDTIDPKTRTLTTAYVRIYGLMAALSLFGRFMFWNSISEDMTRQSTLVPSMVGLVLSCAGLTVACCYTVFEYWRDGGRGTHAARAINGRSAAMAFVALTCASAAYGYCPLPLPADRVAGTMTDIKVDDDSVVTKLDFRLNGRPFAYDCFHRKGDCKARPQILALADDRPHTASVIPVNGTIMALDVDGLPLLDTGRLRAMRILPGSSFWASL